MTEEQFIPLCASYSNPDNPHTVADIIREFYTLPGRECGGVFHVVIDDLNIEREFMLSCVLEAYRGGNQADIEMGELLLSLSTYDLGRSLYEFWETRK